MSTSVLRHIRWGSSGEAGIWEYRGTLTTLVPDPFVPGREIWSTFDAYFGRFARMDGTQTVNLRVMNERPGRD
ncbi:hypothetical protein SEA_PERMAG_61 [Microbacterium phage PermaG]|nr:hypothetical protein SEA_PERMAG_61 [Microbacterium phage PermaG]